MSQSGDKKCPRCKRGMVCRPNDITNCPCSQIQISEETREFLRQSFFESCLCTDCLLEVNQLVLKASSSQLPSSDNLQENIHYSIENNLWVFSELYHVQKGYCCKNECKNCPYGYTAN